MPPRGRAGFFCQSGALGVAILEKVARRGLGLSTFVSAGNRADVSGNDLLQYWEEDDDTEVVLLYLESIGNPRKFSRLARRVSERKPVIAVKSGRSTQGVPMGHAVRSMLAPQAAVDAMFRQAGVIQVDTLDEMFDVAQLVAHQPLPRGSRVAVVGNSDALGLLAADAAVAVGLEVKEPVALGADATAEDFEEALDAAIDDPEVDSVVAVYIPPLNTTGEEVANVLAAVGEQSDKPLVSHVPGQRGHARAAAGARRGRPHRGPRLGAVVPRRRGRRPGAGPGRGVRRLARQAAGRAGRPGDRRHDGRPRAGLEDPRRRRGRPRPGLRRAARAARRPTASTCGSASRRPPRTRRSRPPSGWGTTWCSRPPPSTCASVPTWPTCGATSTPRRRCATPGRRMQELIDDAGRARASSCSGSPRRACR